MPLQREIFTALRPRVFYGVEATGGKENEVACGRGVVLTIDIFLYMTGAHQDDLFGPVDMGRMADFAGVQRSGMHVDFREPRHGLAENLAAFAFGGVLDGDIGPVEEEWIMAAPGKCWIVLPGSKAEEIKDGRASAGGTNGIACFGIKKGDTAGAYSGNTIIAVDDHMAFFYDEEVVGTVRVAIRAVPFIVGYGYAMDIQ